MKGYIFVQKTHRGALLLLACLFTLWSGSIPGASGIETEGSVVLDTPSGKIRGEKYVLPDGTRGMRFLGIPYAKPPLGPLRFAAPVEAGPWEGILDARDFGAVCYQPLETDVWDIFESDVDIGLLEDELERALVAELGTELFEEQVEELHDELRMAVEKAQLKAKMKRRKEEGCSEGVSGDNDECLPSRDSFGSNDMKMASNDTMYRTNRTTAQHSGDVNSFIVSSNSSNSRNNFSNSKSDISRSIENDNSESNETFIATSAHTNRREAMLFESHFSKSKPNDTVLFNRRRSRRQRGDDRRRKNEGRGRETRRKAKDEVNLLHADAMTVTMSSKDSKAKRESGGWKDVTGSLGGYQSGSTRDNRKKPKRRDTNHKRKNFLFMQQKHMREYNMSEDCLTLNVYMPILEGSQKTRSRKREADNAQERGSAHSDDTYEEGLEGRFPVLVYIHGGSFYSNGGRLYPGEKLATKGMVVVTINYRLGPFGFLSTGDRWAPGNWGLLDQRMAMQWVHRHAEAFHGRKDKLLLVGNSAGGASVILHLLSPLSAGLFSRAVALSGCSMAPWSLQADPRHFAQKLAYDVGCPKFPISDLVDCLRRTNAATINKIYAEKNIQDGLDLAFAPVVEGEVSGAFLPRNPKALVEEGSIPRVPLIMTLTRDEVSIWLSHIEQDNIILQEAEKWIYYLMRQKYPDLEPYPLAAVVHAVKASYIYRHGYAETNHPQTMVPIKTISELMSDLGLRVPCIEEAGLLSKWTNLYLGEFVYSSPDDIRIGKQKWIGSYHESDLQFVFGQPFLGLSNTLRSSQDRAVADLLMDVLLAFAHTGVPELDEVEWPEYNQNHLVHLEMGERLSLNHNLVQHRLCFWQQFIPLMTKWPMKPLELSLANPGALSSTLTIVLSVSAIIVASTLQEQPFC